MTCRAKAARARKRVHRYLSGPVDAAGQVVGYRFAPGPPSRARLDAALAAAGQAPPPARLRAGVRW